MNSEQIKKLRRESGGFSSRCKLTEFLYDLMRDKVTPGTVEDIMSDLTGDECNYTNGWLAKYADNVADRLGRIDNVDIIENSEDKIFLTLTKLVSLEYTNHRGASETYRGLGESLVGRKSYEDFYEQATKIKES